MVIGKKAGRLIYGAFLLPTFLSIALGVGLGPLPRASLLGLIALVIAVPTFVGVYRYANDAKKLMPYMGLNVVINIVIPCWLPSGCFWGRWSKVLGFEAKVRSCYC